MILLKSILRDFGPFIFLASVGIFTIRTYVLRRRKNAQRQAEMSDSMLQSAKARRQ